MDIDERPAAANRRRRIGDWEADTMIGKNHKGAIVTLDDRKSKLRLAAPLQGKKADALTHVVIDLLSSLKAFVHTMTFDNGKEFCLHEQLAHATLILQSLTILWNEAKMKMRMVYCVNTFLHQWN